MALLLALSLAVASTGNPIVQVANTDWSGLPLLHRRSYDYLSSKAMQRLFEISQEGKCRLPGHVGKQLDLKLSFAAQFSPDGTLQRLVLPNLNCPEAEGVLAGALIEMVRKGDYRPTKKANSDGWYRGDFGFLISG